MPRRECRGCIQEFAVAAAAPATAAPAGRVRCGSAAARADSLRAQTRWLALTAYWSVTDPPGARLGLTISKRMARRAVDRALVKRIAREAFRRRADDIERAAALAGVRADLNVRLKRMLAPPGTPRTAEPGAVAP